MTEDLAKIDLTTAAQQIRDKIRSAFVELITPEQWSAMIAAELKTFTSDRPSTYRDVAPTPSPFKETVRDELSKFIREKVKEALASPEWQTQWDSTTQQYGPSEMIKQWLLENREAVLASTIQVMFGSALQDFISAAQRNRG